MTALENAIADIGYTESPAGSNRTKYGLWYGSNGVPWCMEAVQKWFADADDPLPYKTASCSSLLKWYKKNQPDCVSSEPEVGCICIFAFSASRWHTGIVESWNDFYVTCIEGNTSSDEKGSQDNGGGVFRRTRKRTLVKAFIIPKEAGQHMNVVKGSTTNEKNMIKAIQASIGAIQDGEIGTQTMSDIACRLGADCFPLTLEIYKAPVIIAKDIVPFCQQTKAKDWLNVISGTFTANNKPCSILIQDGIVRQYSACHAIPYGYPESVLYKTADGRIEIARIKNASELPGKPVWAVGGLGLLDNYDPAAEGFKKCTSGGKTQDFSDVLRSTNHTMLGTKNGYLYLIYCASMTASQVNAFAKKLGLEKAIMLDGGHVAAIKGTEKFAQINTSQVQYCMIQGKRA